MAKAREDIANAKNRLPEPDQQALAILPDTDSTEGKTAWPKLDTNSALAEGTLALHDLFTYAATNYKAMISCLLLFISC